MTKLGIDYLGGVNYVETIIEHHPKGFCAGFLCKASGWKNGIHAARALAETGRCPDIRLHGLWLDSHIFTENDIKTAVTQAKKVAKLKEKSPDIELYFSPWLEHRANTTLFKKCVKACKNVLPKEVKIVSSGLNFLNIGITEVHGSNFSNDNYIFSFDGEDMLDDKLHSRSLFNYHNSHNAKIIFAWTPLLNGKKTLNENTPREKRTTWPKRKHLKDIVSFLEACDYNIINW